MDDNNDADSDENNDANGYDKDESYLVMITILHIGMRRRSIYLVIRMITMMQMGTRRMSLTL